jgi:uncharacterized ion transporter superfamily protein YfcC
MNTFEVWRDFFKIVSFFYFGYFTKIKKNKNKKIKNKNKKIKNKNKKIKNKNSLSKNRSNSY